MGGTSARSPTWRCAAALRLGHRAPAHTAAQESGYKPCVCAGAAQSMFSYTSSFNQPLEAWDVSQVRSMRVRRCPCVIRGSCAHTAAQGCSYNSCTCAGAVQEMFRSASSFNQHLTAWDVGQVTNMGVRCLPASGLGAPVDLCTHSSGGWPQAVRMCWRRAGYVLLRVCNTSRERVQQAAHPHEFHGPSILCMGALES